MPQPKIDRAALIEKVVAAGIQARIDAGEVVERLQSSVPAKRLPRGKSQIVSYYDVNGSYLATYHRLVEADGAFHAHNHPKDAKIGGVKYYDP